MRRALERYYLVAGQKDPLRIDIPKGSYVPFFHQLTAVEPDDGRMIQFQEALARIATAKIGSECDIIARTVGWESKDTPTTQLKTYQAIAYILMFENNLKEGIAEVDRAILLNSHALLHMENCGYLLTLLGGRTGLAGRTIFPLGNPEEMAPVIAERCGGNPFYIQAVVQQAGEQGKVLDSEKQLVHILAVDLSSGFIWGS